MKIVISISARCNFEFSCLPVIDCVGTVRLGGVLNPGTQFQYADYSCNVLGPFFGYLANSHSIDQWWQPSTELSNFVCCFTCKHTTLQSVQLNADALVVAWRVHLWPCGTGALRWHSQSHGAPHFQPNRSHHDKSESHRSIGRNLQFACSNNGLA